MNEAAWVALSLTERIGIKTLRALLKYFDNDVEAILTAEPGELQKVSGVGPKIAQSIRKINLRQIERAIPQWKNAGIQILPLDHPQYPAKLRQLGDAPPTLLLRGVWPVNLERCLAVVGTRTPSRQGNQIAQALSLYLAERGYTVISGLALGIDSVAHMAALAVPNGQTVAVLGCGVLNIYPPRHQTLAEAIIRRGTVLSELHPQASTNPSHLVARNRIITGLSRGLIVVETSVEGGAMYAARFAEQQRCPIYAVDHHASGNQTLIAAGASVIRPDLRDIPFE
jgi:DNA processing protein